MEAKNRSNDLLTTAREAWRRGRYDEALAHFEEAASADVPGAVGAWARALVSSGHLVQAMELLNRHADSDPEAGFLAVVYGFETRSIDATRSLLAKLAHRWGANRWFEMARRVADILAGDARISGSTDPVMHAMESGAAWLRAQSPRARGFGTATALLYHALEAAPGSGLCLEFGVFHGRSIRLIAERRGEVHGFDSFQGLPEKWRDQEPQGSYSTGGEVPAVPEHVHLHEGWFDDTVPPFLNARSEPVAFAHIDCDLYSSSRTVLDAMAPWLRPGTILLFDDFLSYPDYEHHEFRAFHEAADAFDWDWQVIAYAFLGREVAIAIQ